MGRRVGGKRSHQHQAFAFWFRNGVSELPCRFKPQTHRFVDLFQRASWVSPRAAHPGALALLSGEIPAELGNLAHLTQMALSGNELSGAIPSELSNLSNLEGLSLPDNRLSGEIPPELSSLSNLDQLRLNNNELSGEIPSELGQLSNLESLSSAITS